MGVPVAPGVASMSGTYIPELFPGDFVPEFYGETSFAAISNTSTADILKNVGDKATFAKLPDITIRDYVIGQDMVEDSPTPESVVMYVNRAKYFNVPLDRINEKQSHLPLATGIMKHAVATANLALETDLFSDVWADVSALNSGATAGKKSGNVNLGTAASPVELTSSNILEKIIQMGQVLKEQGMKPDESWWLTLPPAFISMLMLSDLKSVYITGDGTSPLRNGSIGRRVGLFNIYESNFLYNADDAFYCMFGHKSALAFVSQITETRVIEKTKSFGKNLQALMVYDAKIIQPDGVGLLVATQG